MVDYFALAPAFLEVPGEAEHPVTLQAVVTEFQTGYCGREIPVQPDVLVQDVPYRNRK